MQPLYADMNRLQAVAIANQPYLTSTCIVLLNSVTTHTCYVVPCPKIFFPHYLLKYYQWILQLIVWKNKNFWNLTEKMWLVNAKKKLINGLHFTWHLYVLFAYLSWEELLKWTCDSLDILTNLELGSFY